MTTTETNVFPIEGLSEYSAKYRLHRVRGLNPEDEDFYRNLNRLATRLARRLKTPATFVLRDEPFIVLRADAPQPEPQQLLVRATAIVEPSSEELALDFASLTGDTRPVALRFLQFSLQGAFWRHRELWQPHGGATYFEKRAQSVGQMVALHRGFIARIVDLAAGGFGICVDVRHKYVSKRPLPARLSRQEFNDRFKGSHVIYHYGHEWFEVRLAACNDLTVTEHGFTTDGRKWTLLEYIQEKCADPLPTELANLPKDCAVVHYFNGRDEQMAAPSALCYLVFDTESPQVRREHGRTQLRPDVRHQLVQDFTSRYLREMRMDRQKFSVAQRPLEMARRFLPMPDWRYGNGKVLSLRGGPDKITVSLAELGTKRLALLRDKNAGFFSTDPLQRQFFFIPQSIHRSWGPRFLADLRRSVDEFYPQQDGYSPELIIYNDSTGPTWVDQGTAVLAAAKEQAAQRGFAVVMLHEPGQRRTRKEDELAAFVLRNLYDDFDIRAAVMHTNTGTEAYQLLTQRDGSAYQARPDKRGKLEGYLRNVALNKVLLTNEKWPFVLADPLRADLTIGVDLKAHHVGFTLIGKGGAHIDTRVHKTRFPEQLRADEFEKHLVEIVRRYHETTGEYAVQIVIHRDGRMFESELKGAKRGLQRLKDDGFIAPHASLTAAEIGKHSAVSVRLFALHRRTATDIQAQNPTIGEYFIPNDTEGYLVSTGYPFAREGTVLPLHVRKVEGALSIEHLLEDLFRLTTLTWSRPEGCSRYPIDIKLNDRRLFEDAGQYDEHEVELHEQEAEL